MNRSHLWKLIIILVVVTLSIGALMPPTARNLTTQFEETATLAPDATLREIVKKAHELDAVSPDQGYNNLHSAIGTNSIIRYFPTNYVNLAVSREPTRDILNRLQKEAAGKIHLGLDLQGGVSFQLEMDTSRFETNKTGGISALEKKFMIEQAIEVLRKRVDKFGVAEPLIQSAGEGRILLQLPGLSENLVADARANIQKAAYLEFRMADPDMSEHFQLGVIPPGYELKQMKVRDRKTDQERYDPIIVRRQAEKGMDGKYVTSAQAAHNPTTGAPEIHFNLTDEGGKIFGEITTANVGKHLAILLDGEVISSPRIEGPITGGSGQITGTFTEKEALELATNLQNPLAAPLKIIQEGSVAASLGQDAIRSGIRASLVGTIAVVVFMLVYYLFAGAVANVALLLNIVVLLGVMCSLDVTLTLPGIAGVVLTVGMAVDANVLIYERMREELAAGKSVRGSVSAGYAKAFGTIFDSNLTTLISSVLLIVLGTGTVKGFGTTLTIGLIASMFTALVVTRLIFDFLLAKGWLKSLPMLHIIRGSNLDFMRVAKPAFAISWALIIVGCAYGVIGRGKNMMGVDFAGGDSLVLSYAQPVELEKVRAAISELKIGDAQLQPGKAIGSDVPTLRITTGFGTGAQVETNLIARFPEAKYHRQGLEQVGATVGAEIQKTAVIATILSLFGILVYVAFRYEFSFAVGAVVAVIHDVLMTAGWYCLTGLTGEGRQFNATFVAAILTIIGFSINDTIVIFDRIREDLKLGVRGSFREIMNQALNQTLSRTIITSGTVFLATLALYFLGGGAINDFAFTFLVGILTGTYSLIYIASALVLWWHKGQRPKLGGGASVTIGSEQAAIEAKA